MPYKCGFLRYEVSKSGKFGSIENIKKASIDELCSIKGITINIAQTIKEKLKEY